MPNLWWIDLRALPGWMAAGLLWSAGLILLGYGLRPRLSRVRAVITVAAALPLLAFAIANAVVFYRLIAAGAVRPGVPVPLSSSSRSASRRSSPASGRAPGRGPRLAGGRASSSRRPSRRPWSPSPSSRWLLFGKTDYRRPANVAVVFGARVYEDGSLSLALSDRVRTACELQKAGLVPKIVFSGGPGDGPIHETEAMAAFAATLDVPAEAMVLDPAGLSTGATVRNTAALFRKEGWGRIIAVSHFYHLPRVKMAYARAGWEVYTVPAEETRTLRKLPYLILREIVALWAYYAAGVLGESRPAEE